jgi:tRNA A-37 threonylcarbamoyl transferase component Bud32
MSLKIPGLMTQSKSRTEKNLTVTSFTLDGRRCSVYVSDRRPQSLLNKFSWPQITADLVAGVGLDQQAAQSGRGGIFFFSGDRAATPLVVRQYRHGGFLRFLRGARFFSRKRFLAELKIHNQAAELGIPVPAAVAVIVTTEERSPFFVNGYFATLRLPDCGTLPEFLQEADSKTRLMIFARVGEYLKKLHENGIYYTDMQVKNILVTRSGIPYFIDFDKSRESEGPLSDVLRSANLRRFWRSLAKYSERGGCLTESDRAAFLTAYAADSNAYGKFYQQLQRGLFRRRLFYRLGWLINRS